MKFNWTYVLIFLEFRSRIMFVNERMAAMCRVVDCQPGHNFLCRWQILVLHSYFRNHRKFTHEYGRFQNDMNYL